MSSMAFSDNSGINEDIRSLALALVSALSKKGMKIAFAESCTGGMAGAAVTEISGSSAVFLGSAVTYSNEAKMKILGVLDTTLAEHGAVSSQCAEEMPNGARSVCVAVLSLKEKKKKKKKEKNKEKCKRKKLEIYKDKNTIRRI